ncbi:MAG: HypC/HybG/HupF family hydrogenase formation chaperone [Calditrichaeota bacterium]|nr:MAG: HypC/HybG/HupF family hydrogenase formation chaperone [Calditrichota bacterium]
MCLAVPAKILEINKNEARADILGVTKTINLMMIEDVKVNDYVLVHVGFALQKIDEEEALKTAELFHEGFNKIK